LLAALVTAAIQIAKRQMDANALDLLRRDPPDVVVPEKKTHFAYGSSRTFCGSKE